jgi:hypothetical protein
VKGTTIISEKGGIQWNRLEIRVSGRVGGYNEKWITSDRYHCD